MLKFINVILMVFFISGCSSKVVPETSNQFQVIGYSQLAQVTTEVRSACIEKLIDKDTCVDLHSKIKSAMELIGSKQGTGKAADLINYIRSKL